MSHAVPHLDLWTHARDLLAAFTRAWGTARTIALRWRMLDEHVAEALKALAPAEALARRLLFAHALTLKLKPPAPRRIVVRTREPKHVSPFTIVALDPLAFRKSLEPPPPFFHIAPRHPLEAPPERWRVRFCVARFAQKDATERARLRPRQVLQDRTRARAPALQGRETIRVAHNRAERRRFASLMPTPAQLRAEAEFERGMQPWDVDAQRTPVVEPMTWRLPERISTEHLARRSEALRRVVDNPARYARPLARRIAKHRPPLQRIVRRWRRYPDAHCAEALTRIELALPAKVDSS